MPPVITAISTRDARFQLQPGEGTDAVHSLSVYAYAVALLETDTSDLKGSGLAFTLGQGNDLVCQAIETLAKPLLGRDIESIMAEFGKVFRSIADHPSYRWLGPHKGVVHLALAAITNACFDLWSKCRGLPLWKLLLSLNVDEIISFLDFSYVKDVFSEEEARKILEDMMPSRAQRMDVLESGYPGYDTSFGWLHFDDDTIVRNVEKATKSGFKALKLKVGSKDKARDIRRAKLVRKLVGPDVKLMFDANQQWSLSTAVEMCEALKEVNPYWIEEPTHPDDVFSHQSLVRAGYPIAIGEAIPNRVTFKNFMQAQAANFIQVDPSRTGGISETILVAMMAKKFCLPVVPHVGDMGQISQHLVLFYHIALGHEKLFLEYIPHLRKYFVTPAQVNEGVYRVPEEPGASSDLRD
ncbi:mitochondrial enolase superfamily member 1-like [Corticium candelabrum]|uniref:mitochondrial enolase superfamily member 1-like n=1 Tax=Corticium candelabrum TaxID=121492 RepID=UPI002E25B3BC|nr:mitochondrial enolase superfamily member 1-like [Corticium candelabrum]